MFSYHYNDDVSKVPTEAILSRAIEAGANGTWQASCGVGNAKESGAQPSIRRHITEIQSLSWEVLLKSSGQNTLATHTSSSPNVAASL